MKYLKKFNETILGDIRRLNPNNKNNDNKAIDLFADIKEDFLQNDKDVRKVSILDDLNKKISFEKLEIGKYYTISYVFGKYHPILRNIHSGNIEAGDRRIKIISIPFSLTLKKNSLEKAFNTSRVKLSKASVIDTKNIHNYDRNPNIGNHKLYNELKDEYNISTDIAKQIFNYFVNEYNNQYPDLKKSRYKNSISISEIENKKSPNKYNLEKEKLIKTINELFINNDIKLETEEYLEYGFSIKRFNPGYDFDIEFRSKVDISSKIRSALNTKVNGYQGKLVNVSEYNNYKFYIIKFEK